MKLQDVYGERRHEQQIAGEIKSRYLVAGNYFNPATTRLK
jgi:hypothetical protein